MKNKGGLAVCATVVTLPGQGERRHNAERIDAACAVIKQCDDDLVVLPAGFLRAPSESEVKKIARPVIEAAQAKKVALLIGVDTEPVRYPDVTRITREKLPGFLLGWSPEDRTVQMWRQRSMSSVDWKAVPLEQRNEVRELRVAGRIVAPIACGECFNPAIRESISRIKPALAVIAAHDAAGARHWAAQERLMWMHVPSIRSVHAASAVTALRINDRYVEARKTDSVNGILTFSFEIFAPPRLHRKAA
jgi:hypothetical protein